MWEFFYIALWWSVWSLADYALLPYSPFSEVAVLWYLLCTLCVRHAYVRYCNKRASRLTETEEAENV